MTNTPDTWKNDPDNSAHKEGAPHGLATAGMVCGVLLLAIGGALQTYSGRHAYQAMFENVLHMFAIMSPRPVLLLRFLSSVGNAVVWSPEVPEWAVGLEIIGGLMVAVSILLRGAKPSDEEAV